MGHCHKWGEKIKNCGFRLTAPREAIINALSNNDSHWSAEDLFLTIHAKHPDIGLTTIYRTLDILEQTGIVVKFDFGHGRAKYELAEEYGKKKHHHHLLCTRCSKIIDYFDFIEEERDYIRKVEKGLARKYGYDIENHMINFYGICPACKTG